MGGVVIVRGFGLLELLGFGLAAKGVRKKEKLASLKQFPFFSQRSSPKSK